MTADPRVLIVGAGIGGLTLARALDRRGIRADLVDIAPRLEPVGAGIALWLNAMAVYEALDLADDLRARGQLITHAAIRSSSGYELTAVTRDELARATGRRDPSLLTIHRGDLHRTLLAGVGGDDRVTLGTSVTRLDDRGSQVAVTFSDGRTADYDAVIGCDGIHSTVREQLFGAVPLRYSGYTCWRVVVDMELEAAGTSEWWGRGERVGLVPIGNGRLYSFLVRTAPRRVDAPWTDLDGFRRAFGRFTGDARRLLETVTDLSQLIHHDLDEVPWLANWHRGRIGLLGDAAHAMTPNMGQGAAMAIEDAWVLAGELTTAFADGSDRADVPAAFARYESRRRSRVKWVQNQSRLIGRVAQWRWTLPALMRNTLVRMTPASATRRMLRRLAQGSPVPLTT